MAKRPKLLDLPACMSVSRNILGAASDFDAFELNVIVILLILLRPFMYVTTTIPNPEELFIRFSSFSGRHTDRETLVERINKLRWKDIRYRIAVPGVNLQVITGLFSSIVSTTGGVLARVSPEAIPWLLYIGNGVGYAQVEPELFLDMTSVYYKRLYLLLCSKLYRGMTSFAIQREQLYDILGIPKGTLIHDVISRYLCGFQKYLDKKGSMYRFSFEMVSRPGAKAGHPTIVSISVVFNIKPEYLDNAKKKGPNIEPLNLLRKLIPILQKRNPGIMNAFEVHDQLLKKGLDEAFLQAMATYSSKSTEHQANTAPLILKDRFNIDIFTRAEHQK